MVATETQRELRISPNWVEHQTRVRAAQAQNWLVGGTLLSLVGFSLPWFKSSAASQYWYSAWNLWRSSGDNWIIIIYLGYVFLVLAAFQLLRRHLIGAAITLTWAIVVVLGALLVLGIHANEAVSGIWSPGLVIMFVGHGVLLTAALTGFLAQCVRDTVLGRD